MFRATYFSVFASLALGEECSPVVEAPSPGCLEHSGGDRTGIPWLDLWCPGHGVGPADTDDYYKCYKIPSLMRTGDGTLLAFVEARKEHCGDGGWIDIRLRRSFDNGNTWTQSTLVYGEGNAQNSIAIGDQIPVWDEATQTVHLIFTRNNEDTMYTSSKDHGATWATPKDITSQVGGHVNTGSGHAGGIQLASGRLLIPMHMWPDSCHTGPKKAYGIFSDDHGETWQVGGECGENECQFAPLPDGTVIALCRKNGGWGGIYAKNTIAYSDDGGVTWRDVQENDNGGLPAPIGGCQTSTLAHPNGKLYHSGPESGRSNLGLRRDMTVKVSEDRGKTWRKINEPWEGAAGYSALTLLGEPDDVNAPIGLLFERNRASLYDPNFVFEAKGHTFTRFHPDGTYFPADTADTQVV